jgi:hypothetical protein
MVTSVYLPRPNVTRVYTMNLVDQTCLSEKKGDGHGGKNNSGADKE